MLLSVEAPSAGGAPTDQIIVVAGFTALVYAGILWVLFRERTGHRTLLGSLADRVAAVDGSPRWFALPMAVSIAGALSGAVGLYWDVSFHISVGRDEGPLANPAHYFIFLGLIAIFAGGALALALADDPLPRRTLRITGSWRTPIGPAVATGISLCALLGFPLDDVWHRLFGQDVTEWGPTHVLMIGGTLMLPYSMLLTCAEARQVSGSRLRSHFERIAILILAAGPVAFLLEFAYGVPQFPLLNDPVVLTVATVSTFMLAMLRGIRWVVGTWLSYAALQGVLVALNVWAFDALVPWPPLLAGGALVAAVLAPRARPSIGYGAVAGVAITMGMLCVEYFWTHATRPMPWPVEMMPWAVLFAGLTGAGVGMISVWLHQQLTRVGTAAVDRGADASGSSARVELPLPRAGLLALVGAAMVLSVFVVNVPPSHETQGTAGVTIGEVENGRAHLDVRVDDALVEDAYWFEALSWQGGGAVHGELTQVEPGVWRTDEPMPLDGSWKTMIRLHSPLHSLVAAPVYLPADAAIPAEEYPAADGLREFTEERQILRREEKQGVPGWLWGTAYTVVGGMFFLLFAIVAVGYAVAGSARPTSTPSSTARPTTTTPSPTRHSRGIKPGPPVNDGAPDDPLVTGRRSGIPR